MEGAARAAESQHILQQESGAQRAGRRRREGRRRRQEGRVKRSREAAAAEHDGRSGTEGGTESQQINVESVNTRRG